MIYTIGLVDDNEDQLSDIRAAIKANKSQDLEINFKTYSIPQNSENAIEILLKEILDDIKNGGIHSLIIDFKIVIATKNIQGSELFNLVKKSLSSFPVVILTERPEESKKPDFIDADKVYIKREFLKIKEAYSKEKITNILDSMVKYVNQKDSLLVKLEEQQTKMNHASDDIQKIIEIENQLAKFIPMGLTQADIQINSTKIAELTTLINNLNHLLEK